jgi:hypothetical protein
MSILLYHPFRHSGVRTPPSRRHRVVFAKIGSAFHHPSVSAKTGQSASRRGFSSPSWDPIMEEGSRKSLESPDRDGQLSNKEENRSTGCGEESGISVSSIWIYSS